MNGIAAHAGNAPTRDAGTTPAPESSPVVIIGGGLGGLSAAIHLRLQGRRVMLLEANEQVGGRANRISEAGFHWDTGPTLLNYPWVFRDLFKAAGRDMDDYLQLVEVDPAVGFQWPDGERLQLSSDYAALLSEFSRFESAAGVKLSAWLRDCERKYRISFDKLVTRNAKSLPDWFSPLSLRELLATSVWRSLDGELKRFFKSRRIREALGAYGMYLGGSPFNLPGIFSILPYGELAYGLWLPKGGIYALVRAIESLAREIGVEIRTGARVSKVRVEQSQATGVELGDEFISARAVVSNVDVPTTETTLLPPAKHKPPRMTPGVLTFYWGVRGKIDGLRHHTIYLPRNYRAAFADLMQNGRIPADLPFYVAAPSETDPSLAPEGDTSLFVLVPTPTLDKLEGTDWSTEVPRLRAQVLERMAAQGAALDDSRIVAEHAWTPQQWRERFGLYQGSAFGAAHNLMQVGPFRAPNAHKSIAGLYYAGASTTPGTGMPLVVLSGRMTAERIAQDVPADAR
jgi:phytoene desaturase